MKDRDFKLTVFGRKVPVKHTEKLKENEDIWGKYDTETKIIQIDNSIIGTIYLETLVHELVHALSDRAGLGQALEEGTEEILADQIAIVIMENFNLELK